MRILIVVATVVVAALILAETSKNPQIEIATLDSEPKPTLKGPVKPIPDFIETRSPGPKPTLNNPTRPIEVEIDVKKIALQKPGLVQKILGRPDSVDPLGSDMQYYSWGFVAYENGVLSTLDYGFKSRPANVSEALEKVGLKKTSEPQSGPLSHFWNSTTGPLVCCGFEFDNIVILGDYSRIVVGIKRRLTEKTSGVSSHSNLPPPIVSLLYIDPSGIEEVRFGSFLAHAIDCIFSIGPRQHAGKLNRKRFSVTFHGGERL